MFQLSNTDNQSVTNGDVESPLSRVDGKPPLSPPRWKDDQASSFSGENKRVSVTPDNPESDRRTYRVASKELSRRIEGRQVQIPREARDGNAPSAMLVKSSIAHLDDDPSISDAGQKSPLSDTSPIDPANQNDEPSVSQHSDHQIPASESTELTGNGEPLTARSLSSMNGAVPQAANTLLYPAAFPVTIILFFRFVLTEIDLRENDA